LVRPAPTHELQLLVLECIGGAEKLFEFLARTPGKMTDIREVRFERGTSRHREHAIVSLFLAATLLLKFEHADRSAFEHDAWICLRVVDDQHVERVAVLCLCRRDETPVIWIT
jgi:hypothetical protein